jgi:hypothetical protein
VDLHAFVPVGFTSSIAKGISHVSGIPYVVGYGFNSTTNRDEALMWVVTASICCPGDFNADGAVNGTDISGFVAKLLAGGACP